MEKLKIVIGFDRPNRIPLYALVDSILENSSIPVEFIFLHKKNLEKFYTRPKGPYDSTEFSITRFLTPYLCNYEGWALFMDNDMLVEGDVADLLEFTKNNDFAVRCVKHNQVVENETKFLGEKQTVYNMKNWTAVMLFNNEKCKMLTPEYVNEAPGLDLHQFKWLNDVEKEIGELPFEWNYLCDVKSIGQEVVKAPKNIHYTEGGPYFNATPNCEYADNWLKVYNRINDYQKH